MLLHTSAGNDDDWRLWLTAAGLPTDLSKQPGITFDMVFMTIQAAIDGIGVAMGRTSYVEDDIAKGRLVVPFKITLPAMPVSIWSRPNAKSRYAKTCRRSGNWLKSRSRRTSRSRWPTQAPPLRAAGSFDFRANND